MRYKKIVLSIIASVLCLGLLSGCGGYSHDFNSSEEAQKYVLAKLKDKYNEEYLPTGGSASSEARRLRPSGNNCILSVSSASSGVRRT